LVVVGVRQAILGDVDGLAQGGHSLQDTVQPDWVNLAVRTLAPGIADLRPRGAAQDRKAASTPLPEAHALPAVVVDAQKIQAIHQRRVPSDAQAEGEAQPAIVQSPQGEPVEQVVEKPGKPDRCRVGWLQGIEDLRRLRQSHLRAPIQFVDHAVSGGVGLEQVAEHAKAQTPRLYPRRVFAEQVPQGGVDARLINGAPQRHQTAQLVNGVAHKTPEVADDGWVAPAALPGEPQGRGEVKEGYHRLDTPLPQTGQDLSIADDGCRIESALLWLDPAPLDREPMGVMSHPGHKVEIALGVAPPVTGKPAAVAVPDGAWLLLKGPPIVVRVVPLHLMRGRGCAPQESLGERQLVVERDASFQTCHSLKVVVLPESTNEGNKQGCARQGHSQALSRDQLPFSHSQGGFQSPAGVRLPLG